MQVQGDTDGDEKFRIYLNQITWLCRTVENLLFLLEQGETDLKVMSEARKLLFDVNWGRNPKPIKVGFFQRIRQWRLGRRIRSRKRSVHHLITKQIEVNQQISANLEKRLRCLEAKFDELELNSSWREVETKVDNIHQILTERVNFLSSALTECMDLVETNEESIRPKRFLYELKDIFKEVLTRGEQT